MLIPARNRITFPRASISSTIRMRQAFTLVTFLLIVPAVAFAQAGGTPFDTGFTAIQTYSPEPSPKSLAWSPSSSAATALRTENQAQRRPLPA
jgi:hypothetical protein